MFISEQNLFFGNTAGVVRMNNYAKALLLNNNVTIVKIPYYSYCFEDNLLHVADRYFVFKQIENIVRKKNISLLQEALFFLDNVEKFLQTLYGSIVIYYYPGSGSILDFILVFYLKCRFKRRVFLEVNEVPKYSSAPVVTKLGGLKRALFSRLFEQTFYFYDGIVCISENIFDYYSNRNKNRVIIPILISIPNCSSNFLVNRSQFSENESVIFLFAGSVAFEKENLEELIIGFSKLHEEIDRVELHLYGSITKDTQDKIISLTRSLGISNKVKYCGIYSNHSVLDVLNRGHALVLPRNNSKQNFYGFSTKLAEYCISSVPVIMTNTGVISSYFEGDFNCLMLDGYNSHSFYLNFKKFLNMTSNERSIIACNAFRTAEKYFDYRIYRTLLYDFLT